MNWQEITVITDQEGTEAAANAFMESGAGGVAIHDPQLIVKYKEAGAWDYDDFPEELLRETAVKVVGYLPVNEYLRDRLTQLEMLLKEYGISYKVELAEVKEEDWATAWKAYYKPEKVTKSLVIKPTWEPYEPSAGEIILELDPGMAFGTGTHPTTVMCLKALEKYLTPGERVIDVGTGSGVLAIAAAKLGAKKVLAVDLDETAVRVARENITQNHAEDKVTTLEGNLLDLIKGGESDLGRKWNDNPPGVVVANIIATIIIRLVPDVAQILEPGKLFITSGIIQERLGEVLEAMAVGGFENVEVLQEGEWAAVVSRKKQPL